MSTPRTPHELRDLLRAGATDLPCGRSIDDIIEQAADARAAQRDAHQQSCPHCQAALREAEQTWRPVRDLATEPVPVPAAIRDLVSAQIKRLAADVWYTLHLTDGGSIRVAARVVATIARDAARRVPNVRAALGRSTERRIARLVEKATFGHKHPHAAVGVLGRTAVVDLAVAVTYGVAAQQVGEQIRQRVAAELRERVGLRDIVVNVTIDDLLE